MKLANRLAFGAAFLLFAVGWPSRAEADEISIDLLSRYDAGGFLGGGSEISKYDAESQRLFTVNAGGGRIDVLDLSDPSQPAWLFSLDVTSFGPTPNSVDVKDGVLAVAVEADVKQDPGTVVLYDLDGHVLSSVQVGALPDMLTFTENGRWLLVANEGEPSGDYLDDPEGSVAVIDMRRGPYCLSQSNVRIADFHAFEDGGLDPSVRVFGPGASVSQDFEPEYIAVSPDERTAYVTLQEANAIAIVDIRSATVVDVVGLGFKDHSLPGNGLDPSNRDGGIAIRNWPVFGMYLPDAIATFRDHGETLLITANEGDSRDYEAFSEEARVGGVALDPTVFPNATLLKTNAALGRLKITTTLGDPDHDGDFDQLFSYGARSFSIWTDGGELVFDSGDQIERIIAAELPDFFNADNEDNLRDERSDDKGPEVEGVVVGRVSGTPYAFICLERISGFVVFDLSEPSDPQFVTYVTSRDFTGTPSLETAGDLGPEGIVFIPAEDSGTGRPLVITSNEVSSTTAIYEITTHRRRNHHDRNDCRR